MKIASDSINSVAGYNWEKTGKAGAIEVDDQRLATDLLSREGYFPADDEAKDFEDEAAEIAATPADALPVEVETNDSDVAEALAASDVTSKKPAAKTVKKATKATSATKE